MGGATPLVGRQAGIRPLIGEILPRRGWAIVPEANRALHDMCARQGIGMLEWYAATKALDADDQKPGYAPDGCHPVRLGRRPWFAPST